MELQKHKRTHLSHERKIRQHRSAAMAVMAAAAREAWHIAEPSTAPRGERTRYANSCRADRRPRWATVAMALERAASGELSPGRAFYLAPPGRHHRINRALKPYWETVTYHLVKIKQLES